jgi:hypothetical protein
MEVSGSYVKKPEYPVLSTRMNGQWEFGGLSPQAYEAFSKEEPRPVGGVLHLRGYILSII